MSTRIKGISLYKNILRAHARYLPHEMKQLGDAYVKAEFRLHTKAQPEQLEGFFAEWDKYLIHVERTGREKQLVDAALIDAAPQQQHGNNANQTINRKKGFGQDVSGDVPFNDEQKEQLQNLREEAINAAKK
eukprot:CAMPEP_0113401550 /NCGR_PEP_ID=MMETSP0013_2-20120614/16757_1 /TAXON_ID=2843 ORGANISM="Skeletonema costatum, Strain 1716" /NCGR_SAMPLE_ID=MMETSP0013_2 /ASSEMBLY_ACC=CAM_ASM_000158 /LENGTH=131 /DNA_ID=CAMNT_0000286775 /DNA_START=103 /DNA_END=498 /DNA_ORIENTATION=+ /assembly_acc=CAM_ASM_000158